MLSGVAVPTLAVFAMAMLGSTTVIGAWPVAERAVPDALCHAMVAVFGMTPRVRRLVAVSRTRA